MFIVCSLPIVHIMCNSAQVTSPLHETDVALCRVLALSTSRLVEKNSQNSPRSSATILLTLSSDGGETIALCRGKGSLDRYIDDRRYDQNIVGRASARWRLRSLRRYAFSHVLDGPTQRT